jgi:hypothetical protein
MIRKLVFSPRGAVPGVFAGLVLAAFLAAAAGAQLGPAPTNTGLASHLAKLDPGRRVGGNTIVGSSSGDVLLGVPNRINFMIAVGSGETIVGGNAGNQLGALGTNATIRGGAGNDAIHGGPGHDVISGGSGNDLIIDPNGSATINTGTGRNKVDVAGHTGRDQVLCAPGSVDLIYANRGDYIAPSCRRSPGSQVVHHRPPPITATRVRNNGCGGGQCTVLAASGRLEGLWSSDKIPRAECPPSHPFLINRNFLPWGTYGPLGVEVTNLGNVDVFAHTLWNAKNYAIGTNGGSITNWKVFPNGWSMWFHCTNVAREGYCFQGRCGS